MTDKAEEIDETDLDTFEAEEPEIDEDEAEEITAADEGDETEAEAEEEDGVVVTIGEEAPPPEEEETERAPEWVRDLRKQRKELKKRNRELEEQLAAATGATKVAELGQEPTLEAFDYDAERYKKELLAYYDRQRKHDEAEAARQAEAEAAEREWKQKLEGYQSAKSDLKVRDFEYAEDTVQETLSVTQQGMILQGSKNPALLVYALGKNPKRAKELASIKDPVKFAFAAAELETQLKVTKRKATSKPEPTISGTGRPSGSVDNTLERLRKEAEKTGNYTEVYAYKQRKKRTA